MRKWLQTIAAALLLATPAHAQVSGSSSLQGGTVNPQIPDLSSCASYAPNFNHIWYIDPVNGFAQNDYTNGTNGAPLVPAIGGASGQGTATHPWNSLQALWGVISVSGSNYTRTGPTTGYPGSLLSTAVGGSSGPITPGDEVLLMNGSGTQYGDIKIGTSTNQLTNSSFVTIAAAPGQTPIVQTLNIVASTKFAFEGVKVQFQSPGTVALLGVSDSTSGGITKDIRFNNMVINSIDNSAVWTTQAQWLAGASVGVYMKATTNPFGGVSCIFFTHNHISNVHLGLSFFVTHSVATDNEIFNFWEDGVDLAGDNQIICRNHIYNWINTGTGAHGDMMQLFIYRGNDWDVLVCNNYINDQEDAGVPFVTVPPLDFTGCIDQTDDIWTRLVITNNVVICHFGGVEVANAHDSLMSNNTVIGKLGSFTSAANGAASDQTVVIRDNIAITMGILDFKITADHNTLYGGTGFVGQIICNGALTNMSGPGTYCNNNVQSAAAASSVFTNYDPSTFNFDMTLSTGSPAIGQGTATTPLAPRDFNGFPRVSPVDLGAYNH